MSTVDEDIQIKNFCHLESPADVHIEELLRLEPKKIQNYIHKKNFSSVMTNLNLFLNL